MKGYFITKEIAEELGLLSNPKLESKLQKTIIVITINDLEEYRLTFDGGISDHSEFVLEKFENWFYQNYYDEIINSIVFQS